MVRNKELVKADKIIIATGARSRVFNRYGARWQKNNYFKRSNELERGAEENAYYWCWSNWRRVRLLL